MKCYALEMLLQSGVLIVLFMRRVSEFIKPSVSSCPLVTADIRPISTRILIFTNHGERKTTDPDDTS
jgi:hypothetical protein